MAAGDLNDGSRFGLPPIGLPQSNLNTPGSDTERRAFPGLATKSSVYAWQADAPILATEIVTNANRTTVINIRQNTATGGVSVDVPTWAAGVIVGFTYETTTQGAPGNTQTYSLFGQPTSLGVSLFRFVNQGVMPGRSTAQVTIPFFDEPLITMIITTGALDVFEYTLRIHGFVRNV